MMTLPRCGPETSPEVREAASRLLAAARGLRAARPGWPTPNEWQVIQDAALAYSRAEEHAAGREADRIHTLPMEPKR